MRHTPSSPAFEESEVLDGERRFVVGELAVRVIKNLRRDVVSDRHVRVVVELQRVGEWSTANGALDPLAVADPRREGHEHHGRDRPEAPCPPQLDLEGPLLRRHRLEVRNHGRQLRIVEVGRGDQRDVRRYRQRSGSPRSSRHFVNSAP